MVRSAAGEPLAGAEVSLCPSEGWLRFSDGQSAPTITDAQGRFAAEGLPGGKLYLRVSAAGYADLVTEVDAGALELRLTLEPACSIAGRILDAESGKPIGGLPLSAWQEGGKLQFTLLSRLPTATSAADGSFTLEGLREGPADLSIAAREPFRGGVYPEKRIRGVAARTRDLLIRLEKGKCIAGRLVDPEGRPIPARGLEVSLHYPWRGKGWRSGGTAVGPNGSFVFDCLASGRYGLSVKSQSFGENRDATWLPARVDDIEAGTEGLVVTLRRGKPIAGRMESGLTEAPEKGYWLHVTPADRRTRLLGNSHSEVHEDGTFVTGALEEGREYDLCVRVGGRFWVARRAKAGATEVVLRPEPMEGVISGTVVDETGKAVPAGVAVIAESRDGILQTVRVETAADGTFALGGLGTSAYRVRGGGLGGEFTWAGSVPSIAPGKKDVVLRVRRGEVLRGTVRASRGTPERHSLILVLDSDGEEVQHSFKTGEDGKFEVTGLPPGEVSVRLDCYAPDGRRDPEIARVRVPCAPLELRAPADEEE
jgi:hypothetical protein